MKPWCGRPWRFAIGLGLVAALGIAEVSSQTVQIQRVMRLKLEHAQRLLGDVVTSNWAGLDRDIRALEALIEDPAWGVLKTPEYARQSEAFRRALQDLREAANRRDETTPLAYVTLTLSCVHCHRDIGRARIAGQTVPPSSVPRR